jgi:hypothetical protein
VLLLATAAPSASQTLDERLNQVGNVYAAAYLKPLVDGVGADFNSGLFLASRLGDARDGFNVHLGVQVMAMPIRGDAKTFSLSYRGEATIEVDAGPRTVQLRLPASFTAQDVPTVFGDTNVGSVIVHVQQDTSIAYLGVLIPLAIDTSFVVESIGGITNALSFVPAAAVNAAVGTVFGTSLLLRWVPAIELEDFGRTSLFGFGVRHNLSRFLPLLPVQVAVQGAWQRGRVLNADGDEVMRATTFAANLEISKRFGPLTLFGGLQTEEGRIRIDYRGRDAEVEERDLFPIDLVLRADNTTRGVVGCVLTLGPVNLYGDVGVGNRTTLSGGLGLTL